MFTSIGEEIAFLATYYIHRIVRRHFSIVPINISQAIRVILTDFL